MRLSSLAPLLLASFALPAVRTRGVNLAILTLGLGAAIQTVVFTNRFFTGIRLGGYEIQALLGSGGMSSVYRGFDPNLQRSVAIKVLSPATA